MPPKTVEIPLPTDRKESARDFLSNHGIEAVEPYFRSGDAQMARSEPFTFYLTRRLGLQSAFETSDALSRGRWIHKRLELMDKSIDIRAQIDFEIQQEEARLSKLAKQLDVKGERLEYYLDKMRRDINASWAWYDAAMHVPVTVARDNNIYDNFAEYLLQPKFKLVGIEVPVECRSDYIRHICAGRFDRLILDTETNELWVVDLKTVDGSAIDRARMAPYESQTILYLHLLERALTAGLLSSYDLPEDVKLGGMIHVIMTKPTIEFGSRDRPYVWGSIGKRSGVSGTARPVGGVWELIVVGDNGKEQYGAFDEDAAITELYERTGKKPEKKYRDEPDIFLYRDRCVDWMLGKGDYADQLTNRLGDPCINISWTPSSWLDSDRLQEYASFAATAVRSIRCKPYPANFPRNAAGMKDWGNKPSVYAPFYINPVENWPQLIVDNNLVVRHRDFEGDV